MIVLTDREKYIIEKAVIEAQMKVNEMINRQLDIIIKLQESVLKQQERIHELTIWKIEHGKR